MYVKVHSVLPGSVNFGKCIESCQQLHTKNNTEKIHWLHVSAVFHWINSPEHSQALGKHYSYGQSHGCA